MEILKNIGIGMAAVTGIVVLLGCFMLFMQLTYGVFPLLIAGVVALELFGKRLRDFFS